MTVIAWDGKTLAADKRAVHAGYVGVQLVAWLRAGAVPADFPKLQAENAANFLVIHDDGRVCQFERTPVPLLFEEGRRAMGSGRGFALAAMHLGHDARAAVEVACALDSGCGNGIDVLVLENRPTGDTDHA